MSANVEVLPFRVGGFSCLALLDGTFTYPPSLFFANLPSAQYEPHLVAAGQSPQAMEVPYICLHVDTGRQRVLVDTGAAGFGATTGRLARLLHEAGIDRRSIDVVVLTHGHPDHIGGNLDESGAPAFPRARHVMFAQEWSYWDAGPTLDELPADDWLKQLILSTAGRNLPPIRRQLDLLTQDEVLVPGIRAIAAPGHTPGHMVLEVTSEEDRLLFLADTVLHVLDVERPDTYAVVDHQPQRMVATRRQWLAEAAHQRTRVMGSHLPFPGIGYVSAAAAGWRWTSLREAAAG